MSKASEWATRPTWPAPGAMMHRTPLATAGVYLFAESRPKLVIDRAPFSHTSGAIYSPTEALALARWILDTFGDGVSTEPKATPS